MIFNFMMLMRRRRGEELIEWILNDPFFQSIRFAASFPFRSELSVNSYKDTETIAVVRKGQRRTLSSEPLPRQVTNNAAAASLGPADSSQH
jgi:hypothetical protein